MILGWALAVVLACVLAFVLGAPWWAFVIFILADLVIYLIVLLSNMTMWR